MAKKNSELKRQEQTQGASDSGPPMDDDYMGPNQLTYFKQKLLTWRSELLDEVDATL
ncbi:MAG: RNA polymerase-binding protein DksA, partial [gamma proteobacterium symbiont of Stewartia floridana]